MSNLIKIGITQGDMNGISYEVILKTFLDTRMSELCIPIIYGSPKAVAYHRKVLNLPEINFTRIENAKDAAAGKSYIINCLDDNIRIEMGKPTAGAGEAAIKCLKRATDDLKNQHLHALVTAPINKQTVQMPDFNFPGHTEYFKSAFASDEVLMLLVNNLMRIGVVTGHVPVSQLPKYITFESILKKLRILNKSLMQDFGIRKPKIAVLALNPHAGDNGVIGDEEKTIIEPALIKAKEEDIIVMGPYPADGFFAAKNYLQFDGVLAMYHDQGLAPFKALDFETGVNYTAGLPAVRTSPDHGVAYEIAGMGKAGPDSFRHSLYLAIDIVKHRKNYREFTKDPLKNIDITNI